jgi:hypothetical protein
VLNFFDSGTKTKDTYDSSLLYRIPEALFSSTHFLIVAVQPAERSQVTPGREQHSTQPAAS